MSSEKNDLDQLTDHVKEYIDTRIELIKLQAVEKSSTVLGSLTARLIVLLLCLSALIFASVSLAYAIAEWTGKVSIGFGIMAIIFFVLAVVLYVNRVNWIKKPFQNNIIKNFFENREE